MATVLDALVVELGFDTDGIEKGRKDIQSIFKSLRDDAEGTGKRIEDSAKKTTEAITSLKNGLLTLLVVFTGGREIKSFIENITNTDVALGKLSRSTEQAVGTISELEGAAAASGGTAAGMAATISNLQSAAQQFALTGQSATIPFLRALRVQLHHAADGAVDVKDELLQMAAGTRGLGNAQAAELFRGAGVSDEGTINLLLRYRNDLPGLARLLDEVNKAGTPSPADIAAANERNRVFTIFDRAITSVGRSILTTLTPTLITLGNHLNRFLEWLRESPERMQWVSIAVEALAGAIGLLSLALAGAGAKALITRSGLGILFSMMGNLVRLIGGALIAGLTELASIVLPLLGAAFTAVGEAILATPIGWLLAAVAALSAGAYLLITHWGQVKSFFKALWNDVASYFEAAASKISKIPLVKWALRKLGVTAPGAEGNAPQPSTSGAGAKPTSAADRAINSVLRNEDATLSGQVTNDTGGVTKYGISSKAFPGLDVANLSLADAKAIYKTEYWDPIGGDSLPAALQATALDAAINQGVGNAKKWLAQSGGDPAKFNALRRGQYERLAAENPGKYGKFLKAWEARVPSATQTALATASQGANVSGIPSGSRTQAALSSSSHSVSNSHNNSSSEVNINGPITVVTKATDAQGIASGLARRLKGSFKVAQAQSGAS